MPHRPVSLRPADGSVAAVELHRHIDMLLAEAEVPVEFPPEVLAAAEEAAGLLGAAASGGEHRDLTAIPFVTLDPASSTDLDQAMHLERADAGYLVRYAIADVPLFVPTGGVIDDEARRRGQTIYLPDRRVSLHPERLSEDAASLLPGQVRAAFVWTFELDDAARVASTTLERARVRSVEKLAYDAVQERIDAGEGHPMMLLLQEIGDKRAQLEAEREGASLNLPEQEVVADGASVHLEWRTPAGIEAANAQLSLMTGMAAAEMMIRGGAGILRTMPPADERTVRRLRRQCEALGKPWPEGLPYGAFLRTLDPAQPRDLALLNQAAGLFRGAGYLAFVSPDQLPAQEHERTQAAIGAPYAHTTAPLRRLVDRFSLLTCHAIATGADLPPALREALPLIPALMQETGSRGGKLERAAIDLVEVMALRDWIGRELEGTVIDRREPSGKGDGQGGAAPARIEVQLLDPPVTTWAEADAAIGEHVRLRVDSVDLAARRAVLTATSTGRDGRSGQEAAGDGA